MNVQHHPGDVTVHDERVLQHDKPLYVLILAQRVGTCLVLVADRVQNDKLVVVGKSRDIFVVWTAVHHHHETLQTGVDHSAHVPRRHIKCDELIGDAHHIPPVGGEFEAEDSKLVSLQGELEWPARRVEAVVDGDQAVGGGGCSVTISDQAPHQPARFLLR